MVKIRLRRVGKRKQPSYRVVVADSRKARDGRIIEAIGHYQPRAEPSRVEIDNDRAVYWLARGAQPSNSVAHLLRISGAMATFKGEPPPAEASAQEARRRATPADSVTATPGAAVSEETSAETDVAAPPQSDSEDG
jgi:small subunit ribosomal protein S16